MQIETISLSKLVPSPANVRKAKTDITGLAANIMAHGLLQNLQVSPNGETYEVVAGGRRLAALKYLAKQKKIAADYGVACEVREGPDATEISLAENEMREAMHPADQFDAFKKLAEDGKGEEEIAVRFGVTPHTVRQRLKLAVVSPKLIAAYRKGTMTLDCLMAFTVADDHRTQEKVWAGLPNYARHRADAIRDALTEKHIAADSKLARFVGMDAYEAAGGAVLRDLFGACRKLLALTAGRAWRSTLPSVVGGRPMILSAIAERLKRRSKDDFKGRHFEAPLIVQAVS